VLPLSIPPIGPQPMTADIRGHDGHAERPESVAVDRVVSRLSFGHRWPRSVTGFPCLRPHRHGRSGYARLSRGPPEALWAMATLSLVVSDHDHGIDSHADGCRDHPDACRIV
jgi:hypothetical protein